MELFLAPIASFLAVTLLVLSLLPQRNADVQSRLATFSGLAKTSRKDLEVSFVARVLTPGLESLGRRISRFASGQVQHQMRELLDQAGNPLSLEILLALRVAGAVLLPTLYLLLTGGGQPSPMQIAIVLLVAYLGSYAPRYWVSHRAETRQKAIQLSLPDALDLVVISMEAGLALDAALAKVAEKTSGPLADEFARTLREMQLGKSRRDALRQLARRCAVKDLTNVVNSIVQADQMGVSMAELMRTQADEVRVARRQRAEERAHQAAVKMTIPLVLFILPSIMLVTVGPAAISLFRVLGHGGL